MVVAEGPALWYVCFKVVPCRLALARGRNPLYVWRWGKKRWGELGVLRGGV